MNPQKLIFVYNAKSGKFYVWLDIAHKLISPNTYPCKLCDITYGISSENNTWKHFREASNIDMIFLHSDEFENAYGKAQAKKFELPVILEDNAGQLKELISKEDFKNINSSETLIEKITSLFAHSS